MSWNEAEINQLRALIEDGLSIVNIADALHKTPKVVFGYLRRNKLNTVRGGRPDWRFGLLADKRAIVAKRYIAGETSGSLAREFNCTVAMIRGAVRDAGHKMNSHGNRFRQFSEEEIGDMAQCWRSGESQSSIARRIGCHQVIVSRILRSRGYHVDARRPRGQKHGSWKGGRLITAEGYTLVLVPMDHACASMRNRTGYVPEHRLVMALALGRPLVGSETVHHVNGDRADNRIENLQLRQGRHGKGAVFVCNECGSHNVSSVTLAENTED